MASHTVIVADFPSFSLTELNNRAYRTNRFQAVSRVLGLLSQLTAAVRGGGLKIQHCTAASVAAAVTVSAYTFGSISPDDTLTIGSVTLTAKASGNGTTQWTIGASNALGTANLMACINANTTLSKYVIATNPTSTSVVVTALIPGSLPNMIVCSKSSSGITVGAAFAGGVGMDSATVSTFAY